MIDLWPLWPPLLHPFSPLVPLLAEGYARVSWVMQTLAAFVKVMIAVRPCLRPPLLWC